MVNVSGWKSNPSERKKSKSIYLSESDWDFLTKEGKGSQTQAIRDMIAIQIDKQRDKKSSVV